MRRGLAAAGVAAVAMMAGWAPAPAGAALRASTSAAACVALFSGSAVPGVPAPAWLRPGAMLTYTGDVDGQQSYQQHMILAVAGGDALDATSLYSLPGTGGVVNGPSPTLDLPASGSDFWASPAGLAQCPAAAAGDTAAGQVAVTRGTTVWRGQRLQTVTVHTAQGLSKTDVLYDAQTGIALQYVDVVLPARRGLTGAEGTLSLDSVDQLPAPFDAAAALPSWVRPGATLHFTAVETATSAINQSEGLPPVQQSASITVHVARVAGPFAWLDVGAASAASTSMVAGGVDGGFWLPPPVIAGIRATRTIFRSAPLDETIEVGRSGGAVEIDLRVGSYEVASYFSPTSGVLLRRVDNNNSTPGDPAVGLPAATVETSVTLQGG